MLFPNFVKHYEKLMESTFRKKVIVYQFSKGGLTSAQILNMLADPFVRHAIEHADIITISAGGNDLMKAGRRFLFSRDDRIIESACEKALANIREMILEIMMIKSGVNSPYLIRFVGLYNPFPFLPASDYWIRTFNQKLMSFSDVHMAVADIYSIFKKEGTRLLSFDGFHPNQRGYQLIAETLHCLGYSPLI